MLPTAFIELSGLLPDRLNGRLDVPHAAEALHRAARAAVEPPDDPALRRLLARHLDAFATAPDLAATVREIRRGLGLSLEAAWRRDPSDLDLLVEVARLDLALGRTRQGRHRLDRVARSGYRAAARARRLIATAAVTPAAGPAAGPAVAEPRHDTGADADG